jgi:hypothetical protein
MFTAPEEVLATRSTEEYLNGNLPISPGLFAAVGLMIWTRSLATLLFRKPKI